MGFHRLCFKFLFMKIKKPGKSSYDVLLGLCFFESLNSKLATLVLITGRINTPESLEPLIHETRFVFTEHANNFQDIRVADPVS